MTSASWHLRLLARFCKTSPQKFLHQLKRQCGMRHPTYTQNRYSKLFVCYNDNLGVMVTAKRCSSYSAAMIVQLEMIDTTEVHRLHMSSYKKVRPICLLDSRLIYIDEYLLARSVLKEYCQTVWDFLDYQCSPELYQLLENATQP